MTQVWSLKLLCFCFFSGVTVENVYQAMHNFVMQLALRGKKNVPALGTFEVCISAACGIISWGDKVSSKEGNKKYRDTVFRDYFNEPVRLLSLCNAILGTQYSDVAELKINTLEGIFFDNQKNDISCTIGDTFLVLVEHQTSVNENMPFRCLSYVAQKERENIKRRQAEGIATRKSVALNLNASKFQNLMTFQDCLSNGRKVSCQAEKR